MKITQKVLLFGLIPALVQAGICFQLFSALAEVENLAAKEARQTNLARMIVKGVGKSVEVAIAAGAYAATPYPMLANEVDLATQRADKVFSELRALTRDDPKTHADIEQMIAIGADSKREFFASKGVDPVENDSPIKNIELDKLQYAHRFVNRIRQLNTMLDRENAQLEETRAMQQQKRGEVKTAALVELVLGIVTLAALYLGFRYDFGRRFNNLLEIAQDLALDRPTQKTIIGSDELAELSEALTTAAEARREAVAQKQLLFQMVTHDLRSPLMAASLAVDNLLNDETTPPAKRHSRLQAVERSLLRVVGLQ